MTVQQSGNVTPGHIATWTTDGVLQDGGLVGSGQTVLAKLLSADFNTLSDQAITLPTGMSAITVTGILVCNATLSLTTAVGGFYPQASKGGTALVANSQVYSSLTTSAKLLSCTLAGAVATTYYTRSNVPDWNIYFSLTAAQGAAAYADIYLLGVQLV